MPSMDQFPLPARSFPVPPVLCVLHVNDPVIFLIHRDGYPQLDGIAGNPETIIWMPGFPPYEFIVCLDKIVKEQPGNLFRRDDLTVHPIHVPIEPCLRVRDLP